ncbi:hypothetical protein K502DRAFT_322982 [Neoconidiobolus thromboides FSU 785]|nr:hypothetical protein K502DRAFT_322982 [Neoconidiobolus thromboides FSU 785]
MHKVVLQIKDESGLKKIEQNLQQLNLPYYTWLEQPENLFTCIATAPILKSQLGDALKKCSLYKI